MLSFESDMMKTGSRPFWASTCPWDTRVPTLLLIVVRPVVIDFDVNTFKIYPSDESDIDQLITKSLVLGDFDLAVTLCLSA